MFLFRLRRPKRTVPHEHARLSSKTAGLWTRRNPGGDIASIPGSTKCHWRGLQLSDIVKMLETTTSRKRTFICIDAVDECAEGYRIKLLSLLNQILQKSPSTRIFVTGRPHIRPEITRRFSGRVTNLSISPKRADIIAYLHTRLTEDTIPDAMDSSLEADILNKIPEEVSEMYVEVATLGKLPQVIH